MSHYVLFCTYASLSSHWNVILQLPPGSVEEVHETYYHIPSSFGHTDWGRSLTKMKCIPDPGRFLIVTKDFISHGPRVHRTPGPHAENRES